MCSCKRHGDQTATCTCPCLHPAPTTPTPEDAARAAAQELGWSTPADLLPDAFVAGATWQRAQDAERVLALFEPETVTTAAELDALPDESVIRDSMGDIGIVDDLYVHYPETARLTRGYVAKRYLPATVLHRGGDR